MSMDDEIGIKGELDGPTGDEVRAIWAQLVLDFRAAKVCFCPSPQDDEADYDDFTCALSHVGDCNALVYSAPRLAKAEAREQVQRHRDDLEFHIHPLRSVTGIEIVDTGNFPCVDREVLFRQPPKTEWVSPVNGQPLPALAPPDEGRLWGDYCRVKVGSRVIHVLHIGLGGDAVGNWFFLPHGIHPARIIANPPH